jgi:hypothetical protein
LSIRHLSIVATLALLGAAPAPARAQGLEVGVKGGLNVATITFSGNDAGPSLDPRIGAVVGGFVTLPIAAWIEVQPEVLYAMKGGTLDDRGVESHVDLDYLDVPVLARISRRGAGRRHYYVAGGPSFGLRLRARSRVDFGSSTEEIDISDDLERLDLGIAVGGGVAFGAIVFDGRYTFGLTDIDRDKTDDVTMKNRTISVTVGVKF